MAKLLFFTSKRSEREARGVVRAHGITPQKYPQRYSPSNELLRYLW
jgi:hypothetical protein